MKLTNFASNVTEEHELFLQALNGLYLSMLTPGRAPTPGDVVTLTDRASKLRESLKARVSGEADELVSALQEGVEKGTSEAMGRLRDDFKARFALLTAHNVHTVTQAARIGRDELGKVFNRPLGDAMGELMLRKMQKLDFKSPDAAGRKWDSNRLMGSVTREFVYRSKLTKQVSQVQGDVAEVFYPDHETDGMIFSITGATPNLPTYTELTASVFHPNSKAEIVSHAAS